MKKENKLNLINNDFNIKNIYKYQKVEYFLKINKNKK